MSSFPGRMKEYPHISLDRFDRENVHARAYFLSHCHKDHMKGLKGPALKRKLQFSRTVRLYCSYVTRELLLSHPKYQFWEEFIVPLELESPTMIQLVDEASGEKEEVLVTLLPAGHCPGSVMFLFEGCRGNVLYTGDFRFSEGQVTRMEPLHSGSRVKELQSVYLDSTFFDPRFFQIPSREVCVDGVSELVHSWVGRSRHHVVWLNCKAAYGYEYLFTRLGQEFDTRIHVNNLNMFKKMPEILSYVTTDRRTQIHACRHPKSEEYLHGNRLPCGSSSSDGVPLSIISIKPSTMWFGERTKKTSVIVRTGPQSYRACFSFHSSYSELKDFLSYLRPNNIYPNVIPLGRSLTEVTHMLQQLSSSSRNSDPSAFVYKPLGALKHSRGEREAHGCCSDDDLFDAPSLEPIRKKLRLQQEVACATSERVQRPDEAPPPVCAEGEEQEAPPPSDARNFTDCTESNDEDEEEEEAPRWEDFFRVEALSDSQNSQSQASGGSAPCEDNSSPCRNNGSMSPDLFPEEEEEEEEEESVKNFSLSLSASLSNHSSQNLESPRPDPALLMSTDTPTSSCRPQDTPTSSSSTPEGVVAPPSPLALAQEDEAMASSQTSSDFEIPSTPESKAPRASELLHLYRKLASGEEVSLGRGS